MQATPRRPIGNLVRHIPREVTTIGAFAIAIFGVVATGSAITSVLIDPTPWTFASAYGGPAALAFGVYWALARRL